MKRYLKLYIHFLSFSFSKALEFRFDFLFKIFMDTIYYIISILFFKIIFLHSSQVAGWTEAQTMIFVATFLLIDAINMTVFSTNLWWLPSYINKGDLDLYLTKPISPLFFLSLREFSANSFVNLLIASGFFLYSLLNYPQTLSLTQYLGFFILIFNGVILYYTLQMLMIIPVFWTHSARGFIDLFYALGVAVERPDRIYKGTLRFIFTTLLPFSLVASYPTRFLFEADSALFFYSTSISICVFLSMIFFWRRGLKNYSSASS